MDTLDRLEYNLAEKDALKFERNILISSWVAVNLVYIVEIGTLTYMEYPKLSYYGIGQLYGLYALQFFVINLLFLSPVGLYSVIMLWNKKLAKMSIPILLLLFIFVEIGLIYYSFYEEMRYVQYSD